MINASGLVITGPEIEAGKVYSVVWDYDSLKHSLKVNDQEFIKYNFVKPKPSTRDLIIGNYSRVDDKYLFEGTISNIKMVSDKSN